MRYHQKPLYQSIQEIQKLHLQYSIQFQQQSVGLNCHEKHLLPTNVFQRGFHIGLWKVLSDKIQQSFFQLHPTEFHIHITNEKYQHFYL